MRQNWTNGDIGEPIRKIDFEPFPETAPIEEPMPVQVPEKEPIKEPLPV